MLMAYYINPFKHSLVMHVNTECLNFACHASNHVEKSTMINLDKPANFETNDAINHTGTWTLS